MTDYHSIPAASASGLKLLNQSPLHYWARYLDPKREPFEPTPTMLLGQRVHCAILEPSDFDNRYTVIPEGLDRRTKEGKEIWAAIQASGKEPLSADSMAQIKRMAGMALAHPVSRAIFSMHELVSEEPIFWTDAEFKIPCKAKPDIILAPCDSFPRGLVVDAKTTPDASPAGFAKAVVNMDMHLQASIYPEAFKQKYGTTDAPDFLWLAIENKPPYATAYYQAPQSVREYGNSEWRRLLAIYAECVRTNTWPGYNEQVTELVMPTWAERLMNDSEEVEVGFV